MSVLQTPANLKGETRVGVPTHLITLTTGMILRFQPVTHANLRFWKKRAGTIPDPELRRQALASIESKTFHCEGGALYGMLAGKHYKEAVRFIVAYQTISDYLDNLCDRSTSQDPDDFRALHDAILHALSPDIVPANYYRFRREQDDGGYLADLVRTCQDALRALPAYAAAAQSLHKLASVYCDLQVYKHIKMSERVGRLTAWYEEYRDSLPEEMTWYEFAACSGSTLGVFCIVAHLYQNDVTQDLITEIQKAYFPWVQGLHILLDYLIDQEEDRAGSDLNFCFYYPDVEQMSKRIGHFYEQAQKSVASLPHAKFHHLINRGLLSIYLADRKVARQKDVKRIAADLLRLGGAATWFFYLHCVVYRRLS